MKPTLLPREEWDFRAQPVKGKDWTNRIRYDFLQDHEVVRCWLYECTRIPTCDCELALEWRSKAPNPNDFDSVLAHYYKADPNGKTGIPPILDWFYRLWPEWPKQPFLAIRRTERERRYREMWSKNPKRALKIVYLSHIHKYVNAVKAGENTSLPGLPHSASRQLEMEPDTFVMKRRIQLTGELPTEIAAFVLDYNLTDTELAEQFMTWLDRRRQDKGYQRQTSVGNSTTKRLRAQLCALGAVRLLDSGLTVKAAQNLTQAVSGKALFAEASEWSTAKQTAREALERAN